MNAIERIEHSKKMQALLQKIPLASLEIRCYGAQITIDCISRTTCEKWADLISKFAKVKCIIATNVPTKKNVGSVNKPSTRKAYRVYATIPTDR